MPATKQPVAVEYVWCSGANAHHDIRSKVCTLECTAAEIESYREDPSILLEKLHRWNFDGSSTGQAKGKDTEILIKPVRVYRHPFITELPSFVALAECFLPSGEPTPDNTRALAREVFEAKEAEGMEPWFGLEQEYVLYKDGRPYGWPADGREPAPQGPYYCSNGAMVAFGREYAQRHYALCLKMGIHVGGMNAEVMPGQWEYQVGRCEGINAGDSVLMSRWVYLRMLEGHGVDVNFDSKPKPGDWNGSGMHCNFSTAAMRAEGGMKVIEEALENMSADPFRDIAAYGDDNAGRMTGAHETSKLDEFTYDVGTRGTSCRIPNNVKSDGRGYFEDRRPSSSADGYLVTARMFASACKIPSPSLDKYLAEREPQWLKDMKERAGKQQKGQQQEHHQSQRRQPQQESEKKSAAPKHAAGFDDGSAARRDSIIG